MTVTYIIIKLICGIIGGALGGFIVVGVDIILEKFKAIKTKKETYKILQRYVDKYNIK